MYNVFISFPSFSQDNWNFDLFDVAVVTSGRPLLFLGMALFKRYNLVSKFNIDRRCLTNFLTAVENGYHKTAPYHNSTHAADVARTVHFFLNASMKEYMSDLEILAIIVASLVHDYDHPGRNNPCKCTCHGRYEHVHVRMFDVTCTYV